MAIFNPGDYSASHQAADAELSKQTAIMSEAISNIQSAATNPKTTSSAIPEVFIVANSKEKVTQVHWNRVDPMMQQWYCEDNNITYKAGQKFIPANYENTCETGRLKQFFYIHYSNPSNNYYVGPYTQILSTLSKEEKKTAEAKNKVRSKRKDRLDRERTFLVQRLAQIEAGQIDPPSWYTTKEQLSKQMKTTEASKKSDTTRTATQKRDGVLAAANTGGTSIFNLGGGDYALNVSVDGSVLSQQIRKKTGSSTVTQVLQSESFWSYVTGAYNHDDKARRDLEKLQQRIKAGDITDEELAAEVRRLNEKYGLNMPENVTGDQIQQVLSDHQEYYYKRMTETMAANMIKQKCEDIVNDKVNEEANRLMEHYGINWKFEGSAIDEMKNIIRGSKTSIFRNKAFIHECEQGLKNYIEQKIDYQIKKYIEDPLNKYSQQAIDKVDALASKANAKVDALADKATNKLDTYRTKVDNMYNKLDPNALKLSMAENMNDFFTENKVAKTIDKVNNFTQAWGVDLGLSECYSAITSNITTTITSQITNAIGPVMENVRGVLKQVSTALQKAKDYVNAVKQKAHELINQWKNKITETIKKYEQKLISSIIKVIKINVVGALGSAFGKSWSF